MNAHPTLGCKADRDRHAGVRAVAHTPRKRSSELSSRRMPEHACDERKRSDLLWESLTGAKEPMVDYNAPFCTYLNANFAEMT
jgi:hypothetical protein